MKNLGKILIFIFLVQYPLLAKIVASVDSSDVERGEMVTYEIMLNGDNIVRPTIATLCGEKVISTGTQTSIQMINGIMTKSYIFSYKFLPQKSCVIKPIEVEIDSKMVKTNSVHVKVSEQKITKDTPFVLTLQSDKKEVYVGEPFEMKLLFKQRNDAEAIDSEFIAPNFNGFWVKDESKSKRYKKDGYTITEKIYKLAPQRVGELKISSAQMRIAFRTHTRDPWAGIISRIKWKSYYSNELSLDVKALPNGLNLVGDFKISAEIDKNTIKANEAVNVTIKVMGEGNLEDVKSFKPILDGVSVFDEKIKVVDGVLTQKMAFVSDGDFTIPPFSLKFFNPETKEIKTIQTKAFHIRVKNSKPKQETLNIQKAKVQKQESTKSTINSCNVSILYGSVIFFLGMVIGMFLSLLKPFQKSKKIKPLDMKDEKLLFIKLLPYKDDLQVAEILEIIETNFYADTKTIIDKKRLKEVVTRYDIS